MRGAFGGLQRCRSSMGGCRDGYPSWSPALRRFHHRLQKGKGYTHTHCLSHSSTCMQAIGVRSCSRVDSHKRVLCKRLFSAVHMFTRAPKYVTHAQGTNVLKLNIFDVDRSLGLERDTYIMECVGTTNIMICVDRRSCFSIKSLSALRRPPSPFASHR